MNETPRLVNRIVLGILGLVLMGAGAGIQAVLLIPAAAHWWQQAAGRFARSTESFAASIAIPGQNSSFLWVGVALLGALLMLAMVIWIANQGKGRTTILAADERVGEAEGLVSINSSLAEQLLSEALVELPELLSVSVTTYELKGEPGLKLRVLPRQGVPPQRIAAVVSTLSEALEELVGQPVPVLLCIGAGARARFTSAERVS